jgi:predicted Rossmann fold flavoprotein
MQTDFDVAIIGAGAAGLMAGIEAAKRGRRVVIIEHNPKPAEKIRISGGGRCNFTNLDAAPKHYLSQNPHFIISALKRFSAHDFLIRLNQAKIEWVEKAPGQLFCRHSALDIINWLLSEFQSFGGQLWLLTNITTIEKISTGFILRNSRQDISCQSLIVASGGLSIPKMGATGLAYEIARQFGHELVPTRPGLVPFVMNEDSRGGLTGLAGLSTTAKVTCGDTAFIDGFLFTHRGLSGPSILQISSFWREGLAIEIDFSPHQKLIDTAHQMVKLKPKSSLIGLMDTHLPHRLGLAMLENLTIDPQKRLAECGNKTLQILSERLHKLSLKPTSSEGYRTAEVTLGGIDTTTISSKTMESEIISGLYFIGECVDVTGFLGGYNFQWAWSSGWAAGQVA